MDDKYILNKLICCDYNEITLLMNEMYDNKITKSYFEEVIKNIVFEYLISLCYMINEISLNDIRML